MTAWWMWDAETATLDPDSPALIERFLTYGVHNPNMTLNAYGVATVESMVSTPGYLIPQRRPGPLDPNVRIPNGTRPDPSPDGHLTVSDPYRLRETDLFGAVYDEATRRITSCYSGASFRLGAVTECAKGCWGGDAACFPLARGLVTPAEIGAGVVNHPLVFSTPKVGSGKPRYPATANAGETPGNLVEGTWLRMAPHATFAYAAYAGMALQDVLQDWELTLIETMQRYGMFLRDTGGSTAIYAVNPINQEGAKAWADVGLTGDSAVFSPGFPWGSLQVLEPPAAA
jgi:hypothetical protein